jgi:ribosome biogenesis protein UTP30
MTTSIDGILVKSAAQALIQRLQSSAQGKNPQLLDDDPDLIYIQIQLKKALTRSVQLPVRVKIPNALYGSRSPLDVSVCVFCKTEDKAAVEQALKCGPDSLVKAVISLTDLKKNYKEYKSQKALLKDHTHFICTASIQRQTYHVLGPNFGRRHLLPVVVRDSVSKISDEVHKVLSSAYVHLSGDNLAIRLAHAKMAPQQIADNVLAGAAFLSAKIQGGWKNVHSIQIKTAFSAAIPVYSRAESELVGFLKSQINSKLLQEPTTTKITKAEKASSKTTAIKSVIKGAAAAAPAQKKVGAKKKQ